MKKKDKIFSIIEIFMILIVIIFSIIGIRWRTLWLDELDWSVGIVQNRNLLEVMSTVLKTGENLPFFYVILYIAKLFFLYNQNILILVTATIPSIIGLISTIKITREFFNKKIEFISAFLFFTSYIYVTFCSWQLRPYGLLFCFSAWCLYFYLKRLKSENYKNIIIYGICMIFLLYTHWFGVLMALCYAIIDGILFLKKKVKFKCIISYLMAGITFLPSFLLLLYYHNGDIGNYGVETTDISIIYSVLQNILGYSPFGVIFFVFSVIMIIYYMIKNKNQIYINVISFSFYILFFGTIFYSIFINPEGSIVRWRYYITILPHTIIMISYTLDIVFDKLSEIFEKFNGLKFDIYIVLIIEIVSRIILIFTLSILVPNSAGNSLYKERAEYLITLEDIYSDNTLIICSYGRAWVEYYFTNKNIELPKNIIVVDPIDYPNTTDMSELDIYNDYEYCVKDGELVKDIPVKDISSYETIYYIQAYRTITSESIQEINKYFELDSNFTNEKNEELNIKRMIKK